MKERCRGLKKEKKSGKTEKNEEKNLKGTLFSVMVLGLLIVASWIGMFAFYLTR